MKMFKSYKDRLSFISKVMLLAGFASLTSCIDEGKDEIKGKGESLIRLGVEDNFALVAFDAVKQTRTIVTINRDAVSASDLSKSMSVEFEISQSALDTYNEENEAEFELLDPEAYELVGITGSSFTFASGEFQKEINLELDPATLDLSKQYAIPLILKNPSNGYSVSSANGFAIVQIIVKNDYDGDYIESGSLVREGNAPDELDAEIPLSTRGATTCVAQAGSSVFGNPGITYLITVNEDNSVTISANPAASVSIYPIGPEDSGNPENSYNPETKTFYLNYEYKNASGLKRTFHTQLVRK